MLFGYWLAINYQLLILENLIRFQNRRELLWIMDNGLNIIDFTMDIMNIYVLL